MKGYFRKRGEKWSFTLDIGRDSEGNRKQKTSGGYKTKKEAEKACAELIAQVENEEYVNESSENFGKFLVQFMETVSKHKIKPSTYNYHMFLIEKHIIPDLGHIRLKNLKAMHLQKMYSAKRETGLTGSYIRGMHAIISKALKQALQWKLIRENVASLATPPRIEKTKIKTWSKEEANLFLNEIKKRKTGNKKFYIVYVLAIYCGLRKGEILGLRWEDCDLQNGFISVRQTLVKIKSVLSFQEPKTSGSIRKIKISPLVVDALNTHRIKQNEVKLQDMNYEDNNLVVANWNGTLVDPPDINRDFTAAYTFVKLPAIRFHDLRHTHATILLQLGENPKVVSERLGHSDVSITLNTYSHVLPSMQESLVHNFELAMQNNKS